METFSRYWTFARGIHRSPVNSPHKGQWRRALVFSLIWAWMNRFCKQSWGWWFGTPSRPLWRHSNDKRLNHTTFFDMCFSSPTQNDEQLFTHHSRKLIQLKCVWLRCDHKLGVLTFNNSIGMSARHHRQNRDNRLQRKKYTDCMHLQSLSELCLIIPLRWRHNERDGVSTHQPHYCLRNHLFRRRSKEASRLRITGLSVGNSPVTG